MINKSDTYIFAGVLCFMINMECSAPVFCIQLIKRNPSRREEIYKRTIHTDKSSQADALFWVFSIVQRKDIPFEGTVCRDFPTGGAGRLPGKPEQNAVPAKGAPWAWHGQVYVRRSTDDTGNKQSYT